MRGVLTQPSQQNGAHLNVFGFGDVKKSKGAQTRNECHQRQTVRVQTAHCMVRPAQFIFQLVIGCIYERHIFRAN